MNLFYSNRTRWINCFVFVVLLLTLSLSAHNVTAQQPAAINLNMQNTDLKQVVWEIERQSGFKFIYNSADIAKIDIPRLVISNRTIDQALSESLRNTGFTFDKVNGVYVIKKQSGPDKVIPQKITVRGTVTLDRSPLQGALVLETGTTNAVVTNKEGIYAISVSPADTTSLTYTFMGLKPVTIRVNNRAIIDVVMEEVVEQIEQVVVTGYGNKAADSYTGSAHIISGEDVGVRAIGTLEEALRGLSPGTITAGSGQPGQELEVRLRGIGSMNTNNQPLYVVDGVVWDQINMSGSSESTINPLNALNPADIANITELKDAASASLYGSRGANGVIVITTKSGMETDKTRFNLNMQAGFAQMTGSPDLVNGAEFAELWTEGQRNYLIKTQLTADGRSGRAELVSELKQLYADKDGYRYGGYNYNQWMKLAQADFNKLFKMPTSDGVSRDYDYFGADRDKLPSTDWLKEVSRLAPFYRINLSMQGGSRTMRYYNSLEYLDQQGTVINSQLKRYSARFKISSESDRQFVNWGLNTVLSNTQQSGPLSSGQHYNVPYYAAVILPPTVPVYLEDGSYNFSLPDNLLNGTHNPVAGAYENTNDRGQTTINLSGWVNLRFTSWLSFRSTGSLYYNGVRRHQYYDNRFGTGLGSNGSLTERDAHARKITNTNLFTVNKTWRGRHRLNVVAGTELIDRHSTYNTMTVTNFATNDKPAATMGSELSSWSGDGSDYSMFSVLSTADYSYRYRYFISGSYRIDQSSRFSPAERLGHFWSVAGAYRISNEPFFKPLLKVINNLRVKGSYGINGNLPDDYYLWRNAFRGYAYLGEPGASQRYHPSPDLTWEGNRIWNVGLDMRMFGNRLEFEVQYYDRRSSDMIQDVPVSMGSGYDYFTMNTDAGIHNTGVEIEIGGTPVKRRKWDIDLSFNIATLKSIYYGLGYQKLNGRQIIMDGISVYSWYMREYGGIDPETGSVLYVKYEDENGPCAPYKAPGTTYTKYQIYGQGIPKITGGFRANIRYANWELSALMSFGAGHYIYDSMGATISNNGRNPRATSITQLDRWTPEHTNAISPLRVNLETNISNHTGYLIKGDYLKIKSVKLQYNIPESIAKKLRLTSAAIYIQAENPWTFSYIKDGYDPEMSLTGYRYIDRYPTASTYTGGITLAF
jgi:TonB-linked SusC/RagA family outer membrane protein